MNETMKESSSIRDARSDDEATMQATNRGTSLGLAIFSMYSLAAGSIALEQSRSGVLVNVNEALIALLITISTISMVLSTFKFALSFETALSSGLCSCATGETFNMLLALLFLIGWGITTAILTFRADSPLAIIGSGYFSAWACALLSTFMFSVNVILRLEPSATAESLNYSTSLISVVAAFTFVVVLTAGVNCGLLGAAYCSVGRTVLAFVVAGISIVVLGLMYLVLNKKLNSGEFGEEKSFMALAFALVVVWALAVGVTTTFTVPFGGVPNGFFAVWGAYLGSCVLFMNSHERFAHEDTRSTVERRALLFILFISSLLVASTGGIECSLLPKCSPYTIYGISIGACQACACAVALKVFWQDGAVYEKYFSVVCVVVSVANAFVLTFAFDSLFSSNTSAYFSVFATVIFSFAYLNQVTPTEDADHLIARCLGSVSVDETHALLRRKVYATAVAVVVNLAAALAVCLNVQCLENELFAFVVGGLSLLLLALIFCFSERPRLLQWLKLSFLALWTIALPYETFQGPFDSLFLSGNGFYSAWAILAGAVWMLF